MLLISNSFSAVSAECTAHKTEYQKLEDACKNLNRDQKRTCKDTNKVQVSALKKKYKECKKKGKNSGDKYCKKLKKYKRKLEGDELSKITTVINGGKCTKADVASFKTAYNAAKKKEKTQKSAKKYCKKLEKYLDKVGDKKAELQSIVDSKVCSKDQYKKYKKLSKGSKNKDKYCKKLEKYLDKVGDKKTDLQVIIDSKSCTKEQYKEYKALAKSSKSKDKYCKKLAKYIDKVGDKKADLQAILDSKTCTKDQYKEYKKLAKGSKNTKKYCDKLEKSVLKKLTSEEDKKTLTDFIAGGNCTKQDYKDWKAKTKGSKSKESFCKKIEKLQKKLDPSIADARILSMEMTKVLESKTCTKRQFSDFKKKAKNFKQSKWCSKYQKLLDKGKVTKDELTIAIETEINNGSCSKAGYKDFQRQARGKGKSKGKYCDKILDILQSNPNVEKKEEWLKMTDPKNTSAQCTKDDYKEVKCLSKNKVWFQVKEGKYKCVSEKKANKKMAKASFKECLAAGGDKKQCKMDMKSLKATYKDKGQQQACLKYYDDFVAKGNARPNDPADPVMLDRLKSMKCISFDIGGAE